MTLFGTDICGIIGSQGKAKEKQGEENAEGNDEILSLEDNTGAEPTDETPVNLPPYS